MKTQQGKITRFSRFLVDADRFTGYVNYTYDDQGREITLYNQDWEQYTNTTYGSNGEVTQRKESGLWHTSIENMSYDSDGNLIQVVTAFHRNDNDWSHSYENYTYENGKLVQLHEGDQYGNHSTNYTHSTNGSVTEECTHEERLFGPEGIDSECIITTEDGDGNILIEVRQNSRNEDGSWQYVFTKTYTWGNPLA